MANKYYKPVCPVCFHDSMGRFGINSEVEKTCKVCKSTIMVRTGETNVTTDILKQDREWIEKLPKKK